MAVDAPINISSSPLDAKIQAFFDTQFGQQNFQADFWGSAKAVWIPDTLEAKIVCISILYERILPKYGTISSLKILAEIIIEGSAHKTGKETLDVDKAELFAIQGWLPLSEEWRRMMDVFIQTRLLVSHFMDGRNQSLTEKEISIIQCIENAIREYSPEQEALFAETLAYSLLDLEVLGSNTPEVVLEILNKANGRTRAFLQKVPFLWRKEFFEKMAKPGITVKHRKIGNRSIHINTNSVDKMARNMKAIGGKWVATSVAATMLRGKFPWVDSVLKRSAMMDQVWTFYYLLRQENEKAWIVVIQDMLWNTDPKHLVYVGTDIGKVTQWIQKFQADMLSAKSSHDVALDMKAGQIFPQIFAIKSLEFDQVALWKLKQQVEGNTSVVQSPERIQDTSHDVVALVDGKFESPMEHHRSLAIELWCRIIGEELEIGEAEWTSLPRYQDHHRGIEIQYSPKLRFLIQYLSHKLEKDEAEKVLVYLFKSGPYILVHGAWGGTIIVSDIDGVGTQVFAQKIDHEFLTKDFSFQDLGDTFWPWTTIRHTALDVDMSGYDNFEAKAWVARVDEALWKSSGYYAELQWSQTKNVAWVLRDLFDAWTLWLSDLTSPRSLESWLDDYNEKLVANTSLAATERKARAIINGRWASLEVSQVIKYLSGHSYFTRYHRHTDVFDIYLTKLLENDLLWARAIFEELRRWHVVALPVQRFLEALKSWTKKMTEIELQTLFSGRNDRKRIINQHQIPYGLYSCPSWIIALGRDPEAVEPGQTQEGYLRDILREERMIEE